MMKQFKMDLRSRLQNTRKCPSMMRGGIGQIPHRKKDDKGFTLVELIVVIVILAILAAILIPGLLKWIDEARDKQYQLEARSIYMATEGELTKMYGQQSSFNNTTITIDSANYSTNLAQIKNLSGLEVKSVKFTVKSVTAGSEDWTITGFETTFVPSNKPAGSTDTVTWHWKATENEWKAGALD